MYSKSVRSRFVEFVVGESKRNRSHLHAHSVVDRDSAQQSRPHRSRSRSPLWTRERVGLRDVHASPNVAEEQQRRGVGYSAMAAILGLDASRVRRSLLLFLYVLFVGSK